MFTRLSQAAHIHDKAVEELIKGIEFMWIRQNGPPTTIEADQESGLISYSAKVALQCMDTELEKKGVGAHARMVDKHHDMLRLMHLRL
eukprot:16441744-Heterocapsa_arctica.AAC.1